MATLSPSPVPAHTPEFRQGIIEVLNRSGQVLHRVHYRGEAISVGRAYDNDIIVDDPYVCPHHLDIRSEGEHLVVRDKGSVNGTWLRRGRRRVERVELGESELLQIGHSQLRYRALDAAVEPAWRDMARAGLLRQFDQGWMPPLALALCIAALAWDKVLDSARQLAPGVLASMLVYPLLGLMLWAGVWAMLNRLFSHRANFGVHLSIAAFGIVALFINAQGMPMLGFAMDWLAAAGWLKLAGQVLIIGVVLYAHMQFATHGRSWTQALGAGVLAALLIGAPQLGAFLQRDEFSSLPSLEPLLKPPGVKMVRGADPEEFFKRAEKLREALDENAEAQDL
jgi:hypothetical protein